MLAQTRRACHLVAVTVALAVSMKVAAMAESRQLADLPPALAATMREARDEAETIAATSPDAASRAEARGSLGMLYHAHRLRFLARDAYARALTDAETARWRYLHGITLAELGEIERAVADFRAVTAADDGNMPAWYRLGVALLLTGDLDGAQESLEKARSLGEDSALVLASLADVASARAEHRTALRLLTRAFELEPEAGQLAFKLARTYRALGDAQGAATWLARSPDNRLAPNIDDPVLLEVAQMSRSARFYEIAADWALARGDLPAAIDALRSAAALTPDDPSIVVKLAKVLADAGRRDEAVVQARRAVGLDKGSQAAWYGLAWLLRTAKDTADVEVAEDAVTRALAIAEDARTRALAGAFDMRAERFGRAAEHYQALVVLRPDDAYAHYWLGMARLGAADCRAREALDDALRLRPDWGEAHIALARADALCGFADAALVRAQALRGAHDDAATRITQAIAEAAAGHLDDARTLAASESTHADAILLLNALATDGLPARAFASGSDWWLPPEIR